MRINILSTSVCALVLLAACSSAKSSSSPDAGPLKPTWTNVYGAVLSKRCLPCHASATGVSLGQLNMGSKDTAYKNLVGVAAKGSLCAGHGQRVAPGQAGSSLLYTKLSTSPPCGSMMPFGMQAVSASQKNLIKDWINAGAMNN